ncbi:MAG: hypothetical protein ACI4JS_04820 [Oscillospiraceae bacterium]
MKIWLFSLITALFLTTTAYAGGFAVERERAVPAPAPLDKKHVEIRWNTAEAETAGVPVVCGEQEEYVLLPVLNTVKKLDAENGELQGTVSFDEKVSESVKGAVSGNTLVQPARTSLYAVNTDDMSVICSRTFGEITTDCAIRGTLSYFGYKDGDGYKFVCADVSQGLKTVWEYSSPEPVTSPASYGDFIVFGAGDKLVVRSAEGDFIENAIPAQITNVFAGKYAIFMTCDDDTAKKVRLEKDGRVETDSLMSCKVGGNLTAPAEFNNRLYIGSADGFFILDGLNMEVLKSYPELKNSSAPLVCYGNGQRVFTVAWSDAEKRDVLYGILDTEEGQTLSEIIKITDFTGGYFTATKNGIMLFRNADGTLWAISQNQISIVLIVVKVVLTLAIFVMLFIILRAWSKKHSKKSTI